MTVLGGYAGIPTRFRPHWPPSSVRAPIKGLMDSDMERRHLGVGARDKASIEQVPDTQRTMHSVVHRACAIPVPQPRHTGLRH